MTDNEAICDLFCALVDLSENAREVYILRGDFDPHIVDAVNELLACASHDDAIFPTEINPADVLAEGQVVGDFKIVGELGRGGMGIVFLAEERPLDRLVALKFLPFPNALLPNDVARLRREARLVAKLAHPSVVKVLRFGETDHKIFIAYDYIEGNDLAYMISERKGPAIDIRKAARFLADIADALHHAHRKKIVHRDVKPSNILVDLKGRGYLTDFGLATATFEAALTQTGTLAGTCSYMSPEQAAARTADIDYRTDIFSLGVVLYELATHRTPFNGENSPQILNAIMTENPVSVCKVNSNIPRDLDLICSKAMQKRPEDRFGSAADMAAELRRFAEGDAISLQPPSRYKKLMSQIRLYKRHITVTVGAALLLVVGLWLGQYFFRTDRAAVTIAAPNGAVSYALSLNAATGQYENPRQLGKGTVRKSLPLGFYRFVVIDANGRFSELSRELRLGRPLTIDSIKMTRPSDLDAIIKIPPSTFISGFEGGPRNQYPLKYHVNKSFYVAKTEVTNAEYLAYMDSTGRSGPQYLTDNIDSMFAKLPVVRVTWHQARDYAEWAGARLATRLEWDRAARSSDGRLYPWGNDDRPGAQVCLLKTNRLPNPRQVDWKSAYFKYACPVNSSPDDVTEDGLADMYGNAAEWVDTPLVFVRDGVAESSSTHRLLRGLGWWQEMHSYGLVGPLEVETTDREQKFYFGFRLAKSDDPLSTTIGMVKK